jgi:hypothetical protein
MSLSPPGHLLDAEYNPINDPALEAAGPANVRKKV